MKNIFIILCALVLFASCDRNQESKPSETDEKEVSNSSPQTTPAEQASKKITVTTVTTEGGVTTDVNRAECAPTHTADSQEYLMCGYQELQAGATAVGAHRSVKNYDCAGANPQMRTALEYQYYGSKPDQALVCEISDTATGTVIAYYKKHNECQQMSDSCTEVK